MKNIHLAKLKSIVYRMKSVTTASRCFLILTRAAGSSNFAESGRKKRLAFINDSPHLP